MLLHRQVTMFFWWLLKPFLPPFFWTVLRSTALSLKTTSHTSTQKLGGRSNSYQVDRAGHRTSDSHIAFPVLMDELIWYCSHSPAIWNASRGAILQAWRITSPCCARKAANNNKTTYFVKSVWPGPYTIRAAKKQPAYNERKRWSPRRCRSPLGHIRKPGCRSLTGILPATRKQAATMQGPFGNGESVNGFFPDSPSRGWSLLRLNI